MSNPEEEVKSVADVARVIESERRSREERSRTFELGGETFTHRAAARMEALADYYDMSSGRSDVSNHEAIEIIDRTVLAFLEPGQDAKWMKVREDPDHPLSVVDAHALIEGLLAATTGRPTERPSVSTDGPGANGTTLTDVSLSKEPISTT
jgi:hypothetical protein